MKKNSKYISGLVQLALIAVVLSLTPACKNNNRQEDSKDIAEEHNDAKFDDKSEKDAQFLVNAAEINLKEIELGQLAEQNGRSPRVKELGKMIADAHAKSQKDLVTLARKKTVTLPASTTDDGKADYKKLGSKSANDFDKSYADMMVNGHRDAIALFEKASENCNDADIKAFATATLPTLRTQLDRSLVCQKAFEKM
jgi:putative membrane protein